MEARRHVSEGGEPVIDQAFDRIARVIEVTLALAFIFGVLLNFANVVGRYLLGLSLLGADEVQIFIMVAMTFLGAAVVTRRNLHLRMDVLVRFLPASARVALRVAEQVLLAALAGFVLTQSYFYALQMWRGGAQRSVAFVQGGVGSIRGSLGVTAVGPSAIFGAISGASAATVATIGKVMVPAMRRAGYPETFIAGLITAVGAIDVIIPPSIPMIVYGAAAEESVARLYAAGVLPGLMIAAMLALYVMFRARRENFGAGEPFPPKVFLTPVR